MDARRALAVVLAVVAMVLCVVALAAAPGFASSEANGALAIGRFAAALGGASGIALRAYLLHRKAGTATGLRRAFVQGGAMALLLLGMLVLAFAIGPDVSRNATLGGDAWAGILATGVVLGGTSGVLWERNERRRRGAVDLLLAAGLIIGGVLGSRIGGAWTVIGGGVLVVGILALGRAMLRGLQELEREMAETAV
jgi:hypothetical protein